MGMVCNQLINAMNTGYCSRYHWVTLIYVQEPSSCKIAKLSCQGPLSWALHNNDYSLVDGSWETVSRKYYPPTTYNGMNNQTTFRSQGFPAFRCEVNCKNYPHVHASSLFTAVRSHCPYVYITGAASWQCTTYEHKRIEYMIQHNTEHP